MTTLEDLIKLYPGRQSQINFLYNLFAYEDEPLPDHLFIHGPSATGKSTVVAAVLRACRIRQASVDLVECYTARILFETILNKLSGHTPDPLKGQPYARCDNMMDFVAALERCAREIDLNRSVVILDGAERLRDSDANSLAAFSRLREFCTEAPCVIFVSSLPFQKYYYRSDIVEPIKIYFPQYSIKELLEILDLDYEIFADIFRNNSRDGHLSIGAEFYRNYLNVFLSVFYRNCRDLNELRYMFKMNYRHYCEPVINGRCRPSDSMTLWKHIAPILKSSLDNLYLRVCTKSDDTINHQAVTFTKKNFAQSIELPFYAKYLLIAAYLASYNSPKEDKRLFMKQHGKKRKTMKDVKAKSKVSEQLNTQIGPKAFGFDRLIAIFYAILEDKVNFNSNLLAQLSTLVELQLLSTSSDCCNLDGPKYKCTVGLDFIQSISHMVGFNVRKYLTDFSYM